jgi:predicted CopG family antitoxin
MAHTTIAIKPETKEKIMEFGMKGETFNEILERILKSARERQLHDLLMNSDNTISIEEAIRRAKKEWPE